jgi:M6 family metalloprotease-like protein
MRHRLGNALRAHVTMVATWMVTGCTSPMACGVPTPPPATELIDCSGFQAPTGEVGPQHPDPWLGDQRALVLLLAWQDAPPNMPVAEVQDTFFGASGSLAAYFKEASGGRFTLSGTVLDWRTVSANWADQQPKDPGSAGRLALCAFADAIDIPGHDSQGNGRIDHLFVVHSGRLPVDRIGPRALFVPGRADRNVLLQARGVGSVGEQLPIGWYVHEAAHRYYGLRDRYGDHRHGQYGIGVWGLMGLGQWGPNGLIPLDDINRYPVHPRARAKMRMGWANDRFLEEDEADVLLEPVETTSQVLRISGGASGFDLVLEVRSPHGFHTDLPRHGLLVWREPHALSGEVTLLQADGRDDLAHGSDLGERPLPPNAENFGDASDPFPGTLGITEVVDPVTGIALRRIRQQGEAVRFDVELPRPSSPPR